MNAEIVKFNQEIEDRIINEIIVDAYDEYERAMGWQGYLEETMTFPFKAQCIKKVKSSPLAVNEIVNVIDASYDGDYGQEVFVDIEWDGVELAVPLKQIIGINVDELTKQAIADWHYWTAKWSCRG